MLFPMVSGWYRFLRSRPLFAAVMMGGAVLVFVAAVVVSALGLEETRSLTDQRGRFYRSLVDIEGVLSHLKDLETGQRGFLISGDEAYLQPYQEARRVLDEQFRVMREGLAGEPLAEEPVERLADLLHERVRLAERNVELRRSGRFDSVSDMDSLAAGKRVMDAVRAEFDTLVQLRADGINRISAELEDVRRRSARIALLAGLLGLVLMLGALALFLREQVLRLRAEAVLAEANRNLEAEVLSRTRELQLALEQIRGFAGDLDRSVEAERRRLAREVHDRIGQIFTAMKLLLRPWQERLADDARWQAQLRDFSALLDEGVDTARRITAELLPPLLDELGLGAALEHHFSRYGAASGVGCRVILHHDDLLAPEQAMALFRIAQEALTNTLRHADARLIRIGDRLGESTYHLVIEDDGRGLADGAAPSHGWRGMRERAALAGGSVDVTPGEQGGTRVEVCLPLRDL